MKKVVRRGLPYMHMGYLLIIVIITTVFGALTTIGASAEVTFDTSPYTYNGETGVTITGFNGLNRGETVTIPDEIDGKPVLAIGLPGVVTTTRIPGADKIGKLETTQTTNLKAILPFAFYYCDGLTSFSAENLETVGDRAFWSCTRLTSFSAPNLETVGSSAFEDNDSCR